MALPTKEHLEWADCELGVIIHYTAGLVGMGDPGDIPPLEAAKLHEICPVQLDTDQWLGAASAMGAKYAVFVANQRNCQGVSLWPSEANPLSLKTAPFRNGCCDMVAEFMASCKKYGIRPGLYYQVGTGGHYYRKAAYRDPSSPEHAEFLRVVEGDLGELWTRYGDLFEIWFDGGALTPEQGGVDVAGILKSYQPRALCFQGPPGHSRNLRWVGNEDGLAPLDCWSCASREGDGFDGAVPDGQVGLGNPDGAIWIPAETDMGNRDARLASGGGWAYQPGEEAFVIPSETLLERYYTSVGRNSNLLMGQCIAPDGLFKDVRQFEELGALIRAIYARPLATAKGEGSCLSLSFDGVREIRHISLMEEQATGERVREFVLEAETPEGTREVFRAHCIGHKRLIPVKGLRASKLTLRIRNSTEMPRIRDMTAYA